jgi:hypothetical protein
MAKQPAVAAPAVAAPAAVVAAPATPAAPAAPAAKTKVGAAVVLEGGERRIDYIRRRYAEGAKRGEIAKELGVAYQIVFAATKKPKEVAAPAAVAAAPVATPAS